ncbi:hypothetical protein D3C80_2119670 [compost metagenome]
MVWLLLLHPGVRRVVTADHIKTIAQQRLAQCIAIGLSLDGWVALDQIAEMGVVPIIE